MECHNKPVKLTMRNPREQRKDKWIALNFKNILQKLAIEKSVLDRMKEFKSLTPEWTRLLKLWG